jgi:hypothetical protein
MAFDPMSIADWLPGLERLPAYFGSDGPEPMYCPLFTRAPELLVIHSGSAGNWVAEYLENPELVRRGIGHQCGDGTWRKVSAAHIGFYQGQTKKLRPGTVPPKTPMRFVQLSRLRNEVPHVGGSVCLGDKHPNRWSIGVELPATSNTHDLFEALLDELLTEVPYLDKWTMHKTIDPQRKRDPVSGSHFSPSWMDGRGLKFVGRLAD